MDKYGDEFKDKTFTNETFSDSGRFNWQNLSGARFVNCTFENIEFVHCHTRDAPARFENCTARKIRMLAASFDNSLFEACDFTDAELKTCTFANCTFDGLNLEAARLDEVTFRRCRCLYLNLERAKCSRVAHADMPGIRLVDFMLLWVGRNVNKEPQFIFTSGAQRTDFIDYCDAQYKRGNFFNYAKSVAPGPLANLRRAGRTIWPLFIGATTNFGDSILRLLIFSIALNALFAFMLYMRRDFAPLGYAETFVYSANVLLNRSPAGPALDGVSEFLISGAGFFIFGLLISVIANKFIGRF